MPKLTLLQGDALAVLKTLPSDSVHCCVTSPPYYGLRDYGTATWEGGDAGCDHKSGRFERGGLSSKQASNPGSAGDEARGNCPKCGARRIDQQIGLERTLDDYLLRLVAVFGEVRRVLRSDGVCFVNIGDSYCSQGGERTYGSFDGVTGRGDATSQRINGAGLKPKDRLLVPFRLALALQADGWWVRDIICWAKRAPMPESVTDRCTQSWEPIFMLTKAARYYWDAEAVKEQTAPEAWHNSDFRRERNREIHPNIGNGERDARSESRNLRNVWLLSPSPYPDAHFATFVPEIPKRCILAGTSAKGVCPKCGEPWVRVVERTTGEPVSFNGSRFDAGKTQEAREHLSAVGNGERTVASRTVGWKPGCACGGEPVPATVLDPFTGSGTTLAVALELGRNAIGIELSEEYVKLAERRCAAVTPGLALA